VPTSPEPRDPTSFFAAAAALNTIDEAVRTAQNTQTPPPAEGGQASSEEALAALLMLRELREQLAGWEPGLIEAARAAGSSWADLAHPLGVRPGTPGTTGEQRVQATRSRRAADRTLTNWARTNAADLRQLAGQITALTDLPAQARTPLARLTEALADNDTASLIDPLTDTHTHLKADHPDLAARISTIAHLADRLRQGGSDHR